MLLLKRTSPRLFRFPDANSGLRVDAPEVLNRGMDLVDKVRRAISTTSSMRDHSDLGYWLAHMPQSPVDVVREGRVRAVLDWDATAALAAQVRTPKPDRENPVGALRRRVATQGAARALEKVLTLEYLLDYAGISPN